MILYLCVPIYEYHCRQCSHEFELLVLKETLVACPSCQSSDLEQLLSGFAVRSDAISAANATAARRAAVSSNDQRDRKIADAEYVKNHAKE
jgi:putative FmdB family regulatory protein